MNCQKPEFQKFCTQVYQFIPGCEEIGKDYIPCTMFSLDDPDKASLVLQLFELRKLFIEKGMVKFTSMGTCMYPCIRPYDVLHIEPRDAGQIRIGDIAVYRNFNRLFGHRTIAKGKDKGLDYILTRPDTAKLGDEGPSYDKDIVGIVSHIERKGKFVDTAKKDYNVFKKIGLGLVLKCFYFREDLFSKVVSFITYIQYFQFYHKMAKVIFSKLGKKIEYSVRIPLDNEKMGKFYRQITPEELIDLNIQNDQNSFLRWILSLDVNSSRAASLSFVFRPGGCPFSGWWLLERKIRIRYRGTGMEEELFEKAQQLLGLLAAAGIYASVYRDSYRERKFFRNLGFKEIDGKEDAYLKDKSNRPAGRVIMHKEAKEIIA
jgi:hypothetical protein